METYNICQAHIAVDVFAHLFSLLLPGGIPILRQVYDRGVSNRDVCDRTCNSFATPTRAPCPVGEEGSQERRREWPSLICEMCLITICCSIMLLKIPRRRLRDYEKTSLISFFSLSLSLSPLLFLSLCCTRRCTVCMRYRKECQRWSSIDCREISAGDF